MVVRAFLANQAKVDAFIEAVLTYPFPQPLVGYKRQLEALEAFDSTSIFSKIAAPTFILAGERDLISPPRQARGLLAEGIPNADILVAPGAAHLLPMEQPGILRQYYSQVPPQALVRGDF